MEIIKPKCGDVNSSGLVYWDTVASSGQERWITPEKFQEWRQKKRDRMSKYIQQEHRKKAQFVSRKKYAAKYPNAQRESDKKQRLKNRDILDERRRQWAAKNPEKVKAAAARSRSTIEKRRAIYKKTLSDPMAKLRIMTRGRINGFIKRSGIRKGMKTVEYLGCDWDCVRMHLEKQFKPGMNWDNHSFSGWHIDHIVPLASAKTHEDLIPLLHYTNLQPLWASENMKKWAKYPNTNQNKNEI